MNGEAPLIAVTPPQHLKIRQMFHRAERKPLYYYRHCHVTPRANIVYLHEAAGSSGAENIADMFRMPVIAL